MNAGAVGSTKGETKIVTQFITINNVNERPVVKSGETIDVEENKLSGYKIVDLKDYVSDPDANDDLTITIRSGNVNGIFKVVQPAPPTETGIIELTKILNYESRADYSLVIEATDDQGLRNSGTIIIKVQDLNEPPVFFEGKGVPLATSREVYEACPDGKTCGTSVVPGKVSTSVGAPCIAGDVDDNVNEAKVTDNWGTVTYEIVDGNVGDTFKVNSSTGQIQVKNVAKLDKEGATPTFALKLRAKDPTASPKHTDMIVNVAILNINEAPEFIGSDAAWKFEIPEKSAVGTSVGAPLSNAAFLSDVDAASTSSFAIVTSVTSGGDGLFSLGATSGQITVASAALDFDTGPKVYEYEVTVTDDGGLKASRFLKIELSDVNEPPIMGSAIDLAREFREKTDAGSGEGTQTKVKGSCPSCAKQQVCANDFESLRKGFDLVYTIKSGNEGVDTSGAAVANAFKTEALNAADTELFGDCTWIVLKTPAAINFETKAQFKLVLRVTEAPSTEDGYDQQYFDEGTMVIDIIDENDAPVFNNVAFSVGENSGTGTLVGSLLAASDEDSADALTYTIKSGDHQALFEIQPVGTSAPVRLGQLKLKMSAGKQIGTEVCSGPCPSGTTTTLTVQCNDGTITNDAVITITVVEQNDPPVVKAATFNIDENSPLNSIIGTVVATDPDDGDALTFSIVSDSPAFQINAATGVVSVKQVAPLNFEQRDAFNVEVQAQDDGDGALTGSAIIKININNVNEKPTLAAGFLRDIDENVLGGTVVPGDAITGTDVDAGQTLAYSITSCEPASECTVNSFVIGVASGVLSVGPNTKLNFERQESYRLTVRATDSDAADPLFSETVVSISVQNVNDAPIAGITNMRVGEDTAKGTILGSVSLSDEDAGETHTFKFGSNNCWRFLVAQPSPNWYHVHQPLVSPGSLSMTFRFAQQAGVPTDVSIWLHRGLDGAGFKAIVSGATKQVNLLSCTPGSGGSPSCSVLKTGVLPDSAFLPSTPQGLVYNKLWFTVNSVDRLNAAQSVTVAFGSGGVPGINTVVTDSRKWIVGAIGGG